MPINPKYLAEFEENGLFHVYNRTNNKELLFINEHHRNFFLQQYVRILFPFLDTFAWSLLPNHFHLLVRVKPIRIIKDHLSNKMVETTLSEKRFLNNDLTVSELLEFTFRRFFQSYTQAFNKNTARSGNLFLKPFKRVSVDKEKQLIQTVLYIHANAVKHKVAKDFTRYKWSSWYSIMKDEPVFIAKEELLNWFGGKEAFMKTHFTQIEKYFDYISAWDV